MPHDPAQPVLATCIREAMACADGRGRRWSAKRCARRLAFDAGGALQPSAIDQAAAHAAVQVAMAILRCGALPGLPADRAFDQPDERDACPQCPACGAWMADITTLADRRRRWCCVSPGCPASRPLAPGPAALLAAAAPSQASPLRVSP